MELTNLIELGRTVGIPWVLSQFAGGGGSAGVWARDVGFPGKLLLWDILVVSSKKWSLGALQTSRFEFLLTVYKQPEVCIRVPNCTWCKIDSDEPDPSSL